MYEYLRFKNLMIYVKDSSASNWAAVVMFWKQLMILRFYEILFDSMKKIGVNPNEFKQNTFGNISGIYIYIYMGTNYYRYS